ncbi:hypothetical protein RvY_16742-2 [Ramazzottius varieornatus]|uniref:HotDog ACOT-type domain-containing protein n=1 Tax=Ramazzottius varieornatus TaxID=947166 RepID=A0A1D1VZL5_RAMVA|nr:hypothetical protein RvY_16742-2 [Ramazzottius varieornatus]
MEREQGENYLQSPNQDCPSRRFCSLIVHLRIFFNFMSRFIWCYLSTPYRSTLPLAHIMVNTCLPVFIFSARKYEKSGWYTHNFQVKRSSCTLAVCGHEKRIFSVNALCCRESTRIQHAVTPLAESQDELPPRRLFDSYDEIIIPLKDNVTKREEYYNAFHKVRFGRLLEDLDMFAVWLTYKHTLSTEDMATARSPMGIVTGMVDRIDVETRDISVEKDIMLRGLVTWVGQSSAETLLLMEQPNDQGEWVKLLEARFVLVARDPKTSRKALLNPLVPSGKEEELLNTEATGSYTRRRQWMEESLFKMPPNADETKLIHDKFLQTVDPRESVFSYRVKPANSEWLSDAVLKNVHICHPQSRNIYGKVFGGFLMRNAFELAWVNAYMYCGSRPLTLTVDDIKFRRPVEIGSILLMSARVSLMYRGG